MKKFKPYIFDISYFGQKDADGGLRHLWDEDALSQSIKLWVASYEGECVRAPGKGGYIMPYLMKPMKQSDVDVIKMSIKDGFYQDFTPYLELNLLKVEPNYEQRYWRIYMEVYSPDLKLKTIVDERIKARV